MSQRRFADGRNARSEPCQVLTDEQFPKRALDEAWRKRHFHQCRASAAEPTT